MDATSKIFAVILGSIQFASIYSANHRNHLREAAVLEAATKGEFQFRLSGQEVTMLNAHHNKVGDPGCFVNVAELGTGDYWLDSTGVIFDPYTSPLKFQIPDCRKLPKQIFPSSNNG